MALCKNAVIVSLVHWSYWSLVLSHQYDVQYIPWNMCTFFVVDIQCCAIIIMMSIFFKIPTMDTLLLARQGKIWGAFVSLNSEMCSRSVTTVLHEISCNIGRRNNGTNLYHKLSSIHEIYLPICFRVMEGYMYLLQNTTKHNCMHIFIGTYSTSSLLLNPGWPVMSEGIIINLNFTWGWTLLPKFTLQSVGFGKVVIDKIILTNMCINK